jgi:nucleotide-binding universal stress UspA family protein
MYKHILVPATGAASDDAVFATALLAARPSGAHLEFLHVKPDVTDMLMAMTSGGLGGGAVVQEVVDRMDAEAKATEQKAWEAFGALCQKEGIATSADGSDGVSAELAVETGSEPQWLAEYGRFADLIVVGRTRDGREVELDVMEAALLDTGRPLLIAPTRVPAALPGVVAIAWKDTPEAARAVAAALPFIERAERVVILSVTEGGQAREATCERLARSLRWHNKRTEVLHLTADGQQPVEQLLAAATALPAGLLVMGGYSHSRLREVVFGGFTQRILRDAGLPVLMAH